MFRELYRATEGMDTVVDTCTVGRKTTAAKYYVSGVEDVLDVLECLSSNKG